MDLTLWLAFTAASSVMLAIPGPTVMLVASYAMTRGRDTGWATVPGVAKQARTGGPAWRRSAPGQGPDVQQRLCGDGAQSQGNRFLRGLRAAIHRSGTSCRCAMRGADCDLRDPGRT